MTTNTNTNTSSACSQAVITRDYQGMAFQFREDGYFNMTNAAKHFGKEVCDFWRNAGVREYCECLAEGLGFNSAVFAGFKSAPSHITETARGRYHGGTWAHPKLAVLFARWLDAKFAVWCDMVIDDLRHGKAQVTITKPEESAVLALPKDFSSALRALADSVEQQEKLKAEKLVLEEEKAVLQPKADTFDLVVAHKRVSVSAFCRTMPGVNLMKVKESLKKLGYLYRLGSYGNYRVYSKFQHYFEERLNAEREGSWELYPTDAGKTLLTQLYKDGKLQMKNS